MSMKPIDRRQLLREEYWARINRVIDHIESRLAEEMTLEDLARVACFSRFHFHRIFQAMVGETLSDFIGRMRIERAAGLLSNRPKMSVIEIALDCGFSGSAAFARAFKRRYGMSATAWRGGGAAEYSKRGKSKSKAGEAIGKTGKDSGRSSAYHDGDDRHHERRNEMFDKKKFKVEVKELPELHVAYIRWIGPYEHIGMAFDKLMKWAGPRGLLRFPETKSLAVYHDNLDITDPNKLRSSACITAPRDTEVGGEVGKMTLAGGKFAVARIELAMGEFADAWQALLAEWLPESGYQPDDRNCYEIYLNDPKDHPQGKFIVDICEPVKPL